MMSKKKEDPYKVLCEKLLERLDDLLEASGNYVKTISTNRDDRDREMMLIRLLYSRLRALRMLTKADIPKGINKEYFYNDTDWDVWIL